MKPAYKDIHHLGKRCGEEPSWYDANGVPRFVPFQPDASSSVYSKEVALVKIACQNCFQEFLVELNWWKYQVVFGGGKEVSIKQSILAWKDRKEEAFCNVHYGDPPSHGCVGDTMNCIDLQVVEFWTRESNFVWERVPDLEIELEKLEAYQ